MSNTDEHEADATRAGNDESRRVLSFLSRLEALADTQGQCDENHPTCDRCRKGKRECTYPGIATSSSKPSTNISTSEHSTSLSPSASEASADDQDSLSAVTGVEDGDELAEDQEPRSATSRDYTLTEPSPKLGKSKTSSRRNMPRPQAGRTSTGLSMPTSVTHSSRWISLPTDVKYYLEYHHDALSYHHYAFKYDGTDFLKTTFLEIAMNDPSAALLYAIASFAAYQHALTRSGENIYPFLAFYNQSITYLQRSLVHRRHNVATLLTILQLATIEEFLGDWVNLSGHQKAAHQILIDLFTPQTIMQGETRRKIIAWYIRFDIFAGIMSGGDTTIGREWIAAAAEFYQRQATDRPDDLGARFEFYFASSRLLATDTTLLFAAKHKDEVSDEHFTNEVERLANEYATYGRRIETAFTDSSCFVKDFPRAPPASADDIVNYRDPNFLYADGLATMNYVLLDFWGIELMFRLQHALAQQRAPPPDLTETALKQCKMFEAVQYSDQGPPGNILGCQASLGISALFLPVDHKHTMWCRRKFAYIEQLGYIYPTTLRKRVSDTWQIDVNHWWLPNDEGYLDIIRIIREFIEHRATIPKDQSSARLNEMSGIFRTFNLDEQGHAGNSKRDSAELDRRSAPLMENDSPEQPG